MLMLARRVEQEVCLFDANQNLLATIKVAELRPSLVRLLIHANPDIAIWRGELCRYDESAQQAREQT